MRQSIHGLKRSKAIRSRERPVLQVHPTGSDQEVYTVHIDLVQTSVDSVASGYRLRDHQFGKVERKSGKELMLKIGIIETLVWKWDVIGSDSYRSQAKRLCERLLDRAATSEGTSTDEDDHGEHEGEDDPADPSESGKSLGRVAVREGEVLISAIGDASSSVGQSSGTSEPEDPGQEERDGVTGDRGDNTTDAEEEESSLFFFCVTGTGNKQAKREVSTLALQAKIYARP